MVTVQLQLAQKSESCWILIENQPIQRECIYKGGVCTEWYGEITKKEGPQWFRRLGIAGLKLCLFGALSFSRCAERNQAWLYEAGAGEEWVKNTGRQRLLLRKPGTIMQRSLCAVVCLRLLLLPCLAKEVIHCFFFFFLSEKSSNCFHRLLKIKPNHY